MNFQIAKEFYFEAAHILEDMPEGHPCGRLHGHSYTMFIHLQGPELSKEGFVRDYGDLKPIREWIDNTLDHRFLNDVLPINPTAELIAMYIYDHFHHDFPEMYAVSVKETRKTIARYEPDNNSR